MARVLCAWEFGGDLGHVRRWVAIGRELRALGHEPLFAFRDLSTASALLREGFECLQSPLLRPPARQNASPLNASDILLNLGYADVAGLAGALRAWISTIALAEPALVAADYAPTALLAARAARLPRVTVGSGFSVPLAGEPLPALRPWAPTANDVLARIDARLLTHVGKAFERLAAAGPAPRRAHEVFAADAHLLCTFPELDPFGPREGVEYLGPQGDGAPAVEARWREVRPRVFAYLKPRDPRFEALVEALRRISADAIVAAPGIGAAQAEALSFGSLRAYPEPLDLDRLLPQADLCVCHAGPGLAARALVAGVPLALLPMQLEQFLVARKLVERGTARMLAPDEPPLDYARWIEEMLAARELRERAAAEAEAHRGYRFDEAARRTARRISAAVGS